MVIYLVGAACFGLSTVVGIKLRDDLTVPTAAALAPAAAALSLRVDASAPWVLVLAGPAVAVVALLIARAPALEIGSHVALFLVIIAGIHQLAAGHEPGSSAVVGMVLAATFVYSTVEVGRQKLSHRGHAHISADLRMWWLLQAVLVCAAGLTVLVVGQLGWAAFVAMVAVLALTKREFEGFGLSRVALDQTVRALERLGERARDQNLTS